MYIPLITHYATVKQIFTFALLNRFLHVICDRRFGCARVVLNDAPGRANVNFLLQDLNLYRIPVTFLLAPSQASFWWRKYRLRWSSYSWVLGCANGQCT